MIFPRRYFGAPKYLLGQLSGVMRAAARSSSYFLGEVTWPTRFPRDCTGSTIPHGSSSNSVCWLSGASTGLHLLILQTTSSWLVQLKDGQIYDQWLPASCAFHAPGLWQSAHEHSLLAFRLLGTISQWIFVILILCPISPARINLQSRINSDPRIPI